MLHGRHSKVLDDEEVTRDDLRDFANKLGSRCNRGTASRRNIVLPHPQPLLLSDSLGFVQQLRILSELCTPVDHLGKTNFEQLLADVTGWVLHSPVKVVVLVHTLQHHVHISIEQTALHEVLCLHRKWLCSVGQARIFSTLESGAGDARQEDRDPVEGREQVASQSRTVTELLDHKRNRLAFERLENILSVVSSIARNQDVSD
mmetsp:Transcript_2017/g.6128  ORF Transcript_2017/g.6128 Transcript_2017/m.6128 type:complete len:203 (+) Transcript_2017:5460-6068(+)